MSAKRMAALLLALLTLCTLFSGCQKKTNTGGKMHYDLAAEPQNLDPQTADDIASMTVISHIFEPLFTLSDTGELLPAAAESYTVSEDGLNYRILLKSGLKWRDGAMLDAEDFAFALKRVLMQETMSPHAGKFFGIQNAQSYHEGKVEFDAVGISHNGLYLHITLNEPDASFLKLLTLTAASPCDEEFFYATKGKYGLEAAATPASGAFYLQAWSHEQYLKLTKNDKYHGAADVKISGVTMWSNNIEGREETFWNGKTHACYVSGESYAARGGADYPAKAIADTVYGIVFSKQNPSLQNAGIRKAIAALFAREGYADALPGYLTVYDRLYPSGCAVNAVPYFQAAKPISAAASVEQAKQWYAQGLSELGVSAVSGLKILVLEEEAVKNGDYFLEISQEFQKQLDLYIGITRLGKEEYEDAVAAGEYDLAIVPIVSEDLSPRSALDDFASGDFACGDETFLSLYRQAASAKSGDLLSLYEQAEEILLKDGWFIPMYEKAGYFVCSRRTAGIRYSPYTGLVSFVDAEFVEE